MAIIHYLKKLNPVSDDIRASFSLLNTRLAEAIDGIEVVTGTHVTPAATVTIRHKKKLQKAHSSGDGPVDACYRAIDKITKKKAKLLTYKLEALTKGKDAQGTVRVELKIKKDVLTGKGTSTDILEASVKAYLDALNRLA